MTGLELFSRDGCPDGLFRHLLTQHKYFLCQTAPTLHSLNVQKHTLAQVVSCNFPLALFVKYCMVELCA